MQIANWKKGTSLLVEMVPSPSGSRLRSICNWPFAICILQLLVPLSLQAAPPFPGGLLDSTGRTVYVSTVTGVAAVDLTRGDVRWQSDLASRPLLVAGDRLYAMAAKDHLLYVRGLDLGGKGEKVFESDPLELPRWVTTQTGPGHSFSCHWKRNHNRLDFTWQASAGAEAGPRKEAAGAAQVDLESGKVRQRATPYPETPAAPRMPPHLEKLAVRWHRSTRWQLVALVVEELPRSNAGHRQERLILRSWNERTGKEAGSKELLRGGRLVVLAGLDDRHLWLRDADPEGSPPATASPVVASSHWSVFAAVDGHLVARVPFVPGTHSATIIGDHAYCLTGGAVRATAEGAARSGRVLHAIDLTTGKIIWRRPGLSSMIAD
jgi:hypothetical protein